MPFPSSFPLDNGDNFVDNTKSRGPETPPLSRSTSPAENLDPPEAPFFKIKFDNPIKEIRKNSPSSSSSNMVDDQPSVMERDLNPSNKEEFVDRLYKFLESRGQPIVKKPSLGYQELDLHLLYRLVVARGGMDKVTQRQEWKAVYQELGIPTMSTSASYNTRTNYKKYLYLYELEYCDSDQTRPRGKEPCFEIGQFIRIVSETYQGQVFYAQILKCRFKEGNNVYYVHYNGWSTSHDEWMPEKVISSLLPEEDGNPEMLSNPPPSRSSKSNHIIADEYFATEKHFHPKTLKKDFSSGDSTPQVRLRPKNPSPEELDDDEPTSFSQFSDSESGYEEAFLPRQAAAQLQQLGKEQTKRRNWKELNKEIVKLNQKTLSEKEDLVDNEDCRTREFNIHQDFKDCYIPYKIDEQALHDLETNPFINRNAPGEAKMNSFHPPNPKDLARYEELFNKVKEGKHNIKRLKLERCILEETLSEKTLTESSSNNGNSGLD
jgi:ParB-like chromosome segregation protein Spo0J